MADISKITLPDGSEYNIKDANAQQKILVSGILEGDGEGGISASDIMDYDTDTASGAVASFTADSVAPLKSLLVNLEPVQEGSGDPSPDNVRPISGWSAVNVWVKPTYDPTSNPTVTIQLGQTVYGGTPDVTNGVLTVDRAMVDMGTLDYYKTSGTSAIGGSVFSVPVSNVGEGMATRDRYASNTMISSMFATAPSSVWWVSEIPDLSISVNTNTLFIADNRYADAATFKTAMSGVQLVYELATPITLPLTPTQIPTLLGTNNIWADTGNVLLTYRKGENALLRDVAELVENLQGKVNVNGILKSNGNGEVFLAEPGTDYATPSQIPAVPSASTANPQMDGAPSPGSTGQWSDGGHTHPTDTTRAAAALEINGHPLTGDFDLTAADVGALASNGTAHASYTLFPTKVYPGTLAAGWYKFAEVNITATSGRAKITFKYGLSNVNYDFIGDIFVYKTGSSTMNCSMQIPYSISGKITYFRYNIDSSNTVSFYVYKHDAYGNPVFTFITSEDINGNYLDPSTYMLGSLVAETPPATALKPIYSAINRWVYNVPVSPGTNQQILSYSFGMITSASVLAKIEFANPGYIKSDCSWETTDGANPNDNGTITITGTCTAATTANLLILNVLPD